MEYIKSITDEHLIEALAFVVAVCALVFSVISYRATQRFNAACVRYEAARAKKATAKFLKAEISILARGRHLFDPTTNALSNSGVQVGRLNYASINAVMLFYAELRQNVRRNKLEQMARDADTALNEFMEFINIEIDDLNRKYKFKKQGH